MKTTWSWLKCGIIGTLLLAVICSATLISQVLTTQSNIKAGIATFRFNLTGLTFVDHSTTVKRVSEPNIIQSLQSGVQSAATDVATAIPGALSQIQSATSTLSTAIPDSIEALLPQNLSLGTKEFCVGFTHNVSCSQLPFNLSSLIPADVQKYVQPYFNDTGSLNGTLANITPVKLYDSLILGLAVMLVMIVVSICFMSFPLILGAKILKIGLLLVLATICCVSVVLPVVILSILDSKAKQLPSWIQVDHGPVGQLVFWGLGFVTLAAITSVISPILP